MKFSTSLSPSRENKISFFIKCEWIKSSEVNRSISSTQPNHHYSCPSTIDLFLFSVKSMAELIWFLKAKYDSIINYTVKVEMWLSTLRTLSPKPCNESSQVRLEIRLTWVMSESICPSMGWRLTWIFGLEGSFSYLDCWRIIIYLEERTYDVDVVHEFFVEVHRLAAARIVTVLNIRNRVHDRFHHSPQAQLELCKNRAARKW